MAASLTLLPSFVEDQWRGLAVLGSFTGSLLLLLAACCLYTGGDWFLVAALWVLFGMGLLFLPYALRRLPAADGTFRPEGFGLSGRRDGAFAPWRWGSTSSTAAWGNGFSPRPPRCSLVFGWSSARCLSGNCRSRDSGGLPMWPAERCFFSCLLEQAAWKREAAGFPRRHCGRYLALPWSSCPL